jgi:hypothetical protein
LGFFADVENISSAEDLILVRFKKTCDTYGVEKFKNLKFSPRLLWPATGGRHFSDERIWYVQFTLI